MLICLEKKLTLSGAVQTYRCDFVSLVDGVGILRYVIDREYDIKGVKLQPGDVTCALYWADRPYTLYIWYLKREHRTFYYFNIADSISLTPGLFVWRDLVIDILIDDQGTAHILDEDEIPADLSDDLRHYINEARTHILMNYPTVVQEATALLSACALS